MKTGTELFEYFFSVLHLPSVSYINTSQAYLGLPTPAVSTAFDPFCILKLQILWDKFSSQPQYAESKVSIM
jgi:hypothetical protein